MAVGGQGSGRRRRCCGCTSTTSATPTRRPIVHGPQERARATCAWPTRRPDCGKRVWYLDLGHPAFGMNPLVRSGERPLAFEAAEVAENVVAALLDIYEDQLFASSRRYLYHAVIGALALADRQAAPPHLRGRLPAPGARRPGLPRRCRPGLRRHPRPGLQPRDFLRVELPDELRYAGSQTTDADGRAAQQDQHAADRRAADPPLLSPPHRTSRCARSSRPATS